MTAIDLSKLSIGLTNRDLCTRCGTCIGICPTGALSIGDNGFPQIDPKLCTNCGLCAKTCPGDTVNFQRLTNLTFGNQPDNPSFDGFIRHTYVGYAAEESLRSGGAGGGVITGLLWDLLKHGDVDGCLVTRMHPERPWEGSSFIARSLEDLQQSQGSKYAVVPHNAILSELRRHSGRYAFAGLPCQIHGLRLMLDADPSLKRKLAVLIGLYCGGALEQYVVPELLRTKGHRKEDISDFQFRGGDWPGKMRALDHSGNIVDLHFSDYKDGAYNYFTMLYSPTRCLTCIDGSAHFSDISIGDVWTRDASGKYKFRAHSRILARTETGSAILHKAIERGSIIANDVTNDPSYRTHRSQTKRKGNRVPLRIARLKQRGIKVPTYDRPEPQKWSWRDAVSDEIDHWIRKLSRHYWFRFPVTVFLTSRWAVPIIVVRRWRKRLKYRN